MKIIKASKLEFIPASHENKKDPGVYKKTLFKKNDFISGNLQMVNWAKLPANKSFNLHYHQDMQEVFIILNGKVEIEINKEKEELSKGDAVLIPIKAKHKMTNLTNKDVEYIVIGISTNKGGETINLG